MWSEEFWRWGQPLVFGYILTWLLIPGLLMNRRKPAASVVAWSLSIMLMPLIGSLLFLLLGLNRVERRRISRRDSNRRLGQKIPEWGQYELLPGEETTELSRGMASLADRLTDARPTQGNVVEVYCETSRTMEEIERAVEGARHSIHLEYYIFQPDETGRRLRDMLIARAKAGVQVRFLYDSLGSMRLHREFLRPMREAGIQVATFLPGQSLRERWSLNLRSHRKIIVVDGLIGFTGGMNIGDEYLGRDPVLGYWRDTHLRLTGPSVLQLQQVFVEDWYYATNEALTSIPVFSEPEHLGDEVTQVIAGGPDQEMEPFHSIFFSAINSAEHHVLLTTSYFVPTTALEMALQNAALRGVRVRVLIPQRSAHPLMIVAGRWFYDSLLAAGVEIYEYHKGLLHSKTITVDGKWSMVGSPNFDARSVTLNFEIGVALFGPRMAHLLEEHFQNDLAEATRIDPVEWSKRSWWLKLAEGICRLFAPQL